MLIFSHMNNQTHITEQVKTNCRNLIAECLKEVDEKLDTTAVLERYLLLMTKELGVYKMSAFKEVVELFNEMLSNGQDGYDYMWDIECDYIKWVDDKDTYVDSWEECDYVTMFVTVKHFDEGNDYSPTLNKIIEYVRSCIDLSDYAEGDVDGWTETIDVEDDDEIKMFGQTLHYSFYTHKFIQQD